MPRQNKRATANVKIPRQNEKAAAKKSHGKLKKPQQKKKRMLWQNKKERANTVFGILSKNIS